jgi:hypothetical protein
MLIVMLDDQQCYIKRDRVASDSRREVKIPVFGSGGDALAINCLSRYGFAARDEVCTVVGNALSS